MKKKLIRATAMLLFFCMTAASFPQGTVYGANENPVNQEDATVGGDNSTSLEEEPDMETPQESTEPSQQPEQEVDGETPTEEETPGNNIPAQESSSEQEYSTDNEETPASEKRESDEISVGEINYVYIESPYVEAPNTQRIVFAFDREVTGADEMSISVQNSSGNQEEWKLTNQIDGLYLFEKSYTDTSPDTYQVVSLNLRNEESEKVLSMSDLNIDAQFGVNQEYDGIEELQPIEGESIDSGNVGASVVTIDENGVAEAQDSIESALNAVSQDTQTQGVQARAARSAAANTSAKSSGNIVVALDPGHDANDAGASANGLREEVLTLKIAQYCKAELEQYAGVTVYMTRTTAACPYNCTSAGSCIEQRVKAAAAKGAKIFVSFHLNAATVSSANGAEVIVPNYNWKYQIGVEGRELAQAILDELTKLGLSDRGIYSKDTTIGEKYPNGSLSDYFSVQIYCKENNIPGIIVEHAFITNSSDVNQFLKTEAGLKKLGVADATGIAKYLGLSKGRWETDSQGNKYYYENGKKVYGSKKISGYWYYFDEKTGKMYTGWRTSDTGSVYYYDSEGRMSVGSAKIDGYFYYFSEMNGVMQKNCWHTSSTGATYYYDKDGHMTFGEATIDGKDYYFSETNGKMYTGFRSVGNDTYYYGSDGQKVKGSKKIDGYWYYFDDSTGKMQTGWRTSATGSVYYYDKDGHMSIGSVKIDGYFYYFSEMNGVMQKNCWHTSSTGAIYYYDKDGHMSFGETEIDGKIYYFSEANGKLQTGFYTTDDGKTYYCDENGQMITGTKKIDGYYYYFKEDGAMHTGWHTSDSGATYYYDEDGHMTFKGKKIDGYWYYFNASNGKMYTGWRTSDSGAKYYYNDEGRMSLGSVKIDGYYYYFSEMNGILQKSCWHTSDSGATYYYDEEGHMIFGGKKIDGYYYYFSEMNGAMQKDYWHTSSAGATYYYDEEGHMTFGGKKVDGYWYYFSTANGKMHTGWRTSSAGDKYYYDEEGHMAFGWVEIDGVSYYFNEMNGKFISKEEELTPIEGTTSVTVDQMVEFYETYSPIDYPAADLKKGGASTLEEFATIYYEEANKEGIKAEVAWAQSMLETGWLKFGGQVKIGQFNFAGLGATDGGAQGADFSGYGKNGVRMGVRAQIQHLKAYASPTITESTLAEPCVDPRFKYVSPKGCAQYVEYLGQQENPDHKGWATAEGYGYKIIDLMEKLKKM